MLHSVVNMNVFLVLMNYCAAFIFFLTGLRALKKEMQWSWIVV